MGMNAQQTNISDISDNDDGMDSVQAAQENLEVAKRRKKEELQKQLHLELKNRGVAIFAIDFSGRPARKISKNHATANAFGCPDSSCFARFDPTRGRNIATQ